MQSHTQARFFFILFISFKSFHRFLFSAIFLLRFFDQGSLEKREEEEKKNRRNVESIKKMRKKKDFSCRFHRFHQQKCWKLIFYMANCEHSIIHMCALVCLPSKKNLLFFTVTFNFSTFQIQSM